LLGARWRSGGGCGRNGHADDGKGEEQATHL
jgi:hypothetical protein